MTTTISPALDAAAMPASISPAIIPAARTVVRRLPDFDAEPPALPLPRQPYTTPPARPNTAEASTAGPQTAPGPVPPDRARLQAHLTLRLIVEVLDGRRPAAQLGGAVTDPVLRYVVYLAGRLDEPRPRASQSGRRHIGHRREGSAERVRGAGLRSMRVCHPAEGVAEVSVVWRYRGRFRALAARFELLESDPAETAEPTAEPRWRCTALRLG
ncbi:MAG TPA: Rv3235 family protein [Pseudonocardia sp.]|uniref:Rv3235 family protein n=1 Tax=Pseudonocardia sp. TaxID=60912 RepID=UPI002CE14740|nr:Rv3235 family protein [Pseudonocardia sp.]HTF46062.1 Rv3235 family protein [Pseudonocardia sp.]